MNRLGFYQLLCLSILFEVRVTGVPLNDSLIFANNCNAPVLRSESVILEDIQMFCTSSFAWTGAGRLHAPFSRHCSLAMSKFWIKEVCSHDVSEFEFLSRGLAQVNRNPQQRTPRRYTYGGLSEAISCGKAMLIDPCGF